MKSLRIFVLDQDLVSAIEGKSDEWKLSMDETVVKILKAGLSGPSSSKPAAKPAVKAVPKPAVKAAPKPVAKPVEKPVEKTVEKPSPKPVEKPADKATKKDDKDLKK